MQTISIDGPNESVAPLEAYVAAVAVPLVIFGYPLCEAIRTCRLQTSAGQTRGYSRAPVNTISASKKQWTHEDRDFVAPCTDLLYFCAWINLEDGPVTLRIPSNPGMDRYFVVQLMDAYTENFVNLSPRIVPEAGAAYILRGPRHTPDTSTDCDIICPTNLVWLLGRVHVRGKKDLANAVAFESGFSLAGPDQTRRPQCVDNWAEEGDEALDFFQNLFAALREYPDPAKQHEALVGFLERAGIRLDREFDVHALKPLVKRGLVRAYREGLHLIRAHTRSQLKKKWAYRLDLGKWGSNHLLRATTAMKALGALSADETVYCIADYDQHGDPLVGHNRYTLRFPPGGLPPVEVFWSVSLYGDDYFCVSNPIQRHSVGQFTDDLVWDADGGLTITISHDPPAPGTNWLPAPAEESFHLIMRLYHPAPRFMAGEYDIPPVYKTSRGGA